MGTENFRNVEEKLCQPGVLQRNRTNILYTILYVKDIYCKDCQVLYL